MIMCGYNKLCECGLCLASHNPILHGVNKTCNSVDSFNTGTVHDCVTSVAVYYCTLKCMHVLTVYI